MEDFGLSTTIDIYLVISADVIGVIDMDTSEVVFSCWCSSVIGWTNNHSHPEAGQSPGNCYFVSYIVRKVDCIHSNDLIVDKMNKIVVIKINEYEYAFSANTVTMS